MSDSLRDDVRTLVRVARANAASSARNGAHGRDVIALLSRAHRAGMAASGLTQDEIADYMGVARQQVARFGSDESTDVPSAKHLARAPDSYADAFFRDFDAVRAEVGHKAMQRLPAPELTHGDDDIRRAAALILATANAQRAALLLQKPSTSASELAIIERELMQCAVATLEAVERVRQLRRESGR